jgi:hypothetical protein
MARQPAGSGSSIESELMRQLQHGGLDKEHLASIVKTLDGFQQQGLKIEKVLTKGIPRPDSVEVHSTLTAANLASIVDLLKRGGQIEQVIVFPRGIPVFENFLTQITVR